VELETVLYGLSITVVGMGLVFLALALLVVAMEVMVRVLRPRAAPGPEIPSPEPDREERARVAAMAAALVLARNQSVSHAGDAGACRTGRHSLPLAGGPSHPNPGPPAGLEATRRRQPWTGFAFASASDRTT
jgi:sodium pump decarboxylase gamma subunit